MQLTNTSLLDSTDQLGIWLWCPVPTTPDHLHQSVDVLQESSAYIIYSVQLTQSIASFAHRQQQSQWIQSMRCSRMLTSCSCCLQTFPAFLGQKRRRWNAPKLACRAAYLTKLSFKQTVMCTHAYDLHIIQNEEWQGP